MHRRAPVSDLLQVQQLEVLYDTSQVLFGLNLTLRQGETLA
jgi:ABC-type branched-subunit amino acid transport system ATPase component